MLTEAQSTVLRIIRQHIAQHGVAPTLAELCEYTHTRSAGSMTKHLKALERVGLIDRSNGGWRSAIVKDVCPCCGQKHKADRLDRLEIAMHRIAGHGNITGQRAREIASEALGIKLPD